MKHIILFLLVSLLCLGLVSCGSEKGENKETDGQSDSGTAAEETLAEEPTPEKKSALPEGINPNDYDVFVQFDLPENFRQAAVDYMKKMATLEWTPLVDYSFGLNRENWKYTFELKAGTTYTGLPYSSGNRAYDEFIKNINENGGKFFDTTPIEEMQQTGNNMKTWGVECNSSTNAAIQQFSPVAKAVARQYMPSFTDEFIGKVLGDIKVTPGLRRTEQIVAENDADAIYEGYAQLKLGDIIMTKNEDSGLCHVRMISVEPEVARNGAGRINPSRSFVKCVEQTDAFDQNRNDGVLTTWRVDKMYTFTELYTRNYLPITLEVYETNISVIPYLALDEAPTAETLAKGSINGTLSSDYPIQYCYLDLYNKDGDLVSRVAQHERNGVFKLNLRKYNYSLFTKDIVAGDYTFVVYAGLNCGGAELCRIDFTYNG
ncbi:MAG: hypothetical protein IJN17_08345 [Clostridia bacterium]|nr:hypothetical protein [Clostridia bacterium]